MSNMRRERSAGFIVMRETRRGALFLLLRSQSGFWGFPKGKIKKGERCIDAAVREMKEETGIERFFAVCGFRVRYAYAYGERKQKAHKVVTMYAAKTDSAAVTLSPEHTAFRWLSREKAVSCLAFHNAQKAFMRASRFFAYSKKAIIMQERVYREARRVPKGRVTTYAAIAQRCGISPRTAARMLANNYDPRTPCHRVVASSGAILGYNRGVKKKARLLRREGVLFSVARSGERRIAKTTPQQYTI